MSIKCERTTCKHCKRLSPNLWICQHGGGYDHPSGKDIKINKFGHCISFEKQEGK